MTNTESVAAEIALWIIAAFFFSLICVTYAINYVLLRVGIPVTVIWWLVK